MVYIITKSDQCKTGLSDDKIQLPLERSLARCQAVHMDGLLVTGKV